MNFSKFVLIVISVVGLSACASPNSAKNSAGNGLAKIYTADYNRTWNACTKAIKETKGKIVEQNRSTGDIAVSYGVTPFSWGERVGIFMQSVGPQETKVEVVSKRAVAMNITAANWQKRLHNKIENNLNND